MKVEPKGHETSLALYPQKIMSTYHEIKPSIVFYPETLMVFVYRLKKMALNSQKNLRNFPGEN